MPLERKRIIQLFNLLNERLAAEAVIGELYLLGGAVMCLAFRSRPSTFDVDAVFAPQEIVRVEAARVGRELGIGEGWLNDAAKGFLSDRGEFSPWLDLSHLKIYIPVPEYLLAMKCLAMRLGPEFKDEADVRYLLRYLNVEKSANAIAMVERYYPADRIPLKTLYALREMLGES